MANEGVKMHDPLVYCATTYVSKCVCEKADEEYRNLLKGAKKLDRQMRCKIHPENFRKLPSIKKHPIPGHLAIAIHAARFDKSAINDDACIALDDCVRKLRVAGFELKHGNNGPSFMVNNNDPYDMLSKQTYDWRAREDEDFGHASI
ncbi:hypothetical protein SCHPADRAFT_253534 [Schizopora paradoxa]|uniref:Uncharacterized protein n=1 Tax=Schizopora paradoxa TaxID=27342 RepID=A0A0H2RU82_9AGAM|nr:hypothetical protein SCHPADRAFT_253534 [Schizopora paradoxa]